MNIQVRKYRVIEKVLKLNNSQLEKVESTLENSLQLDLSLNRATKQVENGYVKPHSEVRKKYEKWL